ncbi:hypothetical protein AB0J21_00685 [Streptomyces sp. NPDC049954]|uniref:hypothetical protein n=1 Tax=Streptomyces sp. NPDC049954 TaxID=3155779 RepID=UPI003425BE5F
MSQTVGFFDELSAPEGVGRCGPVRDFTRSTGPSDEEEIRHYLRSGVTVRVAWESERDAVDPAAPALPGGATLLTDGTWIWRADLAYYVGRYHVALPAAFLSLVRARAFVVPELSAADLAPLRARYA